MKVRVTSAIVLFASLVVSVPSEAQQYITLDQFRAQFGDEFGRIDDSVVGFLSLVEQFSFARELGVGTTPAFPEFETFTNAARSAVDTVPIPSGSTSVTYTFDPAVETFVREIRPLSPTLSQNARTNGKNVLSLGASWSYLDYQDFEGQDPGRVVFSAAPLRISDRPELLARDVLLYEFKLKESIYAVSAQFGVLANLDVGIFVPIIDLEFRGKAIDRFFLEDTRTGAVQPANLRSRGDGSCCFIEEDPGAPGFPNVNAIDRTGFANVNFPGIRFDDDETGIGDIIVRAKYFIGSAGPVDAGVLFGISVPSGDEDNLLGVGSVRFDPRLILSSSTSRFSVHFNGGYHADVDDGDRDRFDYSTGGEVRVTDWATVLLDQVGRVEVRGQSMVRKFELAPGVKVNPVATLTIGFNAIVPLNDEGLSTDWTPNGLVDASFVF